MNIKSNITELIGNTPLFDVSSFFETSNKIYAKLEYLNPTGSIKDRAAFYIIKDAIKEGTLKKGGTIIEATSGNTGIGLAAIGVSLGFKVILTMPSSMSIERVKLLKAYGATIELSDASKGMQGAIDLANEIHSKMENSIIAGQFDNMSNPTAHYETTSREIYDSLDNNLDVFISTFGTGGTISGCAKYFKEKNCNIKIIGVEPESSAFITKGEKGAHKIQGIGAGFKPNVLDLNLVDEILTVSNEDAYAYCRNFAKKFGILVGISSGAALCGVQKYITKLNLQNKIIATILPDSGDRYLSVESLFN